MKQEIEQDKKIIEALRGATQDLHELNERLDKKCTMWLFDDKLFKDQDELYNYIEKDMIENGDCMITKGNIEQLVLDKITEEAEEIDIFEEEK